MNWIASSSSYDSSSLLRGRPTAPSFCLVESSAQISIYHFSCPLRIIAVKQIKYEPVGIRADKTAEVHSRKVKVLHLMLVGIVGEIPKLSLPEKNVISRMISNSIFDMRVIWSGLYSQGLVDALAANPKTQKCAEHYYPRQVAGQRILQHIERYKGISLKKLEEFLDVFTRVHYTTSQENQLLKPYQKVDTFISPEHSYQMAGITLQKVK